MPASDCIVAVQAGISHDTPQHRDREQGNDRDNDEGHEPHRMAESRLRPLGAGEQMESSADSSVGARGARCGLRCADVADR